MYDVIVVGAGHNGLASALYLSKAGLSVLVLEKNDRIGGAVMSAEVTLPGFIHDLYATNMNLFLASPVYQDFKGELEQQGLEFSHSNHPFCNAFPGGESLKVYQGAEKTLGEIRAHNAADAEGWEKLYQSYKTLSKALLPLYETELPSFKALTLLANAARVIGMEQLLEQARLLMSSTRELGEAYLSTPEARMLLATWGMHLDYGPDVSGGALFPVLEAFGDMENGMVVAKGGASKVVEAMASLIRASGGEIRTGAEVRSIFSMGGHVSGVELVSGERIEARKAVIANLTPNLLFNRLLANHPFSPRFQQKVQHYRFGPATMVLHLALNGPVPWEGGDLLNRFAYVHIGPYVDDLARAYTASLNGYLPANPLTIVGQTSAVDATRAPQGQQVLWVQVRTLPRQIRGDEAGQIQGEDWDAIGEAYADRVMDKLERYAPGLKNRVLKRTVFTPAHLERHNPNLNGGDSISGSHHIRQYYLFRPFPGWSNYAMPLDGLYMVGASTWPGAGTNGVSGTLAAKHILNPHPVRNGLLKGSAFAGATLAAAALIMKEVNQNRD